MRISDWSSDVCSSDLEILAPDGTNVNAVRGLLGYISYLVEQYDPTHLVCCWDDDWRPSWRVALLPTYKAHRAVEEVPAGPAVAEVPDPLQAQAIGRAACRERGARLLEVPVGAG